MTLGVPALVPAQQAQQQEYIRVSGQYMAEHEYQIGQDLAVRVSIDGLRWTLLSIKTKDNEPIQPGVDTTVFITLKYDNTTSSKLKARVVILLEDQNGQSLGDRVELPEEKLQKSAAKDFEYKLSLPGTILLATRKVYLFCEVR